MPSKKKLDTGLKSMLTTYFTSSIDSQCQFQLKNVLVLKGRLQAFGVDLT